MKSLICEYCGSGSFHKMESNLICDYCGVWKAMVYPEFSDELSLCSSKGSTREIADRFKRHPEDKWNVLDHFNG